MTLLDAAVDPVLTAKDLTPLGLALAALFLVIKLLDALFPLLLDKIRSAKGTSDGRSKTPAEPLPATDTRSAIDRVLRAIEQLQHQLDEQCEAHEAQLQLLADEKVKLALIEERQLEHREGIRELLREIRNERTKS